MLCPTRSSKLIFGQLCNALDPRSAVAFSSASKGLREPMQRVGEGAGKSPLQQLQEENAAAAALGRKGGGAELQGAARGEVDRLSCNEGLSATDLATLGKLIPVLPALEELRLSRTVSLTRPRRRAAGGGAGRGRAAGRDPLHARQRDLCVGDAGASALAAALDRGALPRLEYLALRSAAIGDAGLAALAPALRRQPALEHLYLAGNPFGDEGLAASRCATG